MKRFHVHLSVADLAQSIEFYSNLFGQAPSVERNDYAKWMLDDPRLNFAVSTRHDTLGVNHFGFQAENADDLAVLKQRAEAAAGDSVVDQGETACCYAMSDKHWTVDPSGFAWEHYLTMGDIKEFGVDKNDTSIACCVPTAAKPKISIPVKAASTCCTPKDSNSGCC